MSCRTCTSTGLHSAVTPFHRKWPPKPEMTIFVHVFLVKSLFCLENEVQMHMEAFFCTQFAFLATNRIWWTLFKCFIRFLYQQLFQQMWDTCHFLNIFVWKKLKNSHFFGFCTTLRLPTRLKHRTHCCAIPYQCPNLVSFEFRSKYWTSCTKKSEKLSLFDIFQPNFGRKSNCINGKLTSRHPYEP